MRKIIILVTFCILVVEATSQLTHKNECGTRTPLNPAFIDATLLAQNRLAFSTPYLIKVFIHVIADNDGSNVAVPDTAIIRQLENARDFYAPHNICFIVAGMEQVNNTDLNIHNTATEETELNPYLVANALNVFVHRALLLNTDTLNGNAYGIPSNFLSMGSYAIMSTTNRSTLAHEMGHCLGLYHTFETFADNRPENVPRSGSCTNCSLNGDLLCDTEADRDEGVDSNCVYQGTLTDACYNSFAPNTHNLMTYGNRACRNFFTVGQGQRAFNMVTITPSLNSTIAADDISVFANANFTSGRQFLTARNTVTINTPSYVVADAAKMNMNSHSIIISAGARFSPTGNGYTIIRSNTLCQ